jgi:hypothetical protein
VILASDLAPSHPQNATTADNNKKIYFFIAL